MTDDLIILLREFWVLWLMGLFIGIVVWVYWPSRRRRQQMRDHAEIPFRNDDPPSQDDTGNAGGPRNKDD